MPIDAEKAVAAEPRSAEITWDHKDIQLYHLGLGAGRPATDPAELRYTLESRLHVLPSFATVAGAGMGVVGGLSAPGIEVDLAAVLHGGQSITLHRPIPVAGKAVTTSRVAAVYDKGKAAILVLRSEVADGDGPLWTSDAQIFVRGEGGFGGDRGPSTRLPAPEGDPDLEVERPVREDQALLYRLSGDWNPLHADPEFAALAGFDRPILHGLCTYGMTLKAVVDTQLDGDVSRVRGYSTRFTGVVFPGETLRIRMWRGDGRVQATVTAAERGDAPVLADTLVEHA
ncbi:MULTISPECIES: MaoC/PaaZ C-terminal domain-containing protein [Streptomyces]|uniref:3-alpha,7-alpha, 12-alpha-trihydroxy-5-beta-cholest-24-enoyl-CoA hydratase n=1 Tax=Streptomyces venezuelae TaxID=54571 RepID=A0A5P2BEX3_STRVZ|nr:MULTISPECIES: MaoC/PaaZ C-terminal domain-containing protein [Streptomyces]NEA02701.1 3-alpha,7-alpha,12-alpha-trihydroxy-5-beta-cholest-24-enoyl-CoA hydratase [Streptomyces sp. SID10116]MYY84744.1 3-alpha,7-alpha,12-alpha-trihydroxy-5-beta-cholest-24-enoyl-CoA hydratase [Streptomyces sp. SID335]MYZ13269.1 3-alpha,7-alpha,12-alpha-trihydroxy-5-beta-cholest-24-enoyl-CoA hydratase [Streptomyces sp. SID337]NDZ87147.1 3-alpha,7-alpha,12-alpha-trihydroxy-5-beta-cholest-24-enoyl-CoA hydratase [Str